MKNFASYFKYKKSLEECQRNKDQYWIETDTFMEASNITQKFQTEGIQATRYPNVQTPQSTVDNPSLSRFEIYPNAQTFCGKPDPLYSTQYDDIFVAYLDGFHMNTAQPRPRSMIDQRISGQIQYDNSNKKYYSLHSIYQTISPL